jgi:hypothetical protein
MALRECYGLASRCLQGSKIHSRNQRPLPRRVTLNAVFTASMAVASITSGGDLNSSREHHQNPREQD